MHLEILQYICMGFANSLVALANSLVQWKWRPWTSAGLPVQKLVHFKLDVHVYVYCSRLAQDRWQGLPACLLGVLTCSIKGQFCRSVCIRIRWQMPNIR